MPFQCDSIARGSELKGGALEAGYMMDRDRDAGCACGMLSPTNLEPKDPTHMMHGIRLHPSLYGEHAPNTSKSACPRTTGPCKNVSRSPSVDGSPGHTAHAQDGSSLVVPADPEDTLRTRQPIHLGGVLSLGTLGRLLVRMLALSHQRRHRTPVVSGMRQVCGLLERSDCERIHAAHRDKSTKRSAGLAGQDPAQVQRHAHSRKLACWVLMSVCPMGWVSTSTPQC